MNTPKPYNEKRNGNTIYRNFSQDIDESELVWHLDKEDRYVKVLNESDWGFQMDNELPIHLTKGTELFIPKETYHRVLKGRTDLNILIKEGVENNTMVFWHGGDLTDINNTFKQQTKKQEYGPGLYLTTSYEVVKKYIKGSRKLYRVEVALGNSLERTDIPYDNVLQFLNRLPKSISIKLKDKFDEYNKNGFVSAEIINNVFVNYNLLKPEISYKLKQFYLENNIDYSLVNNAFGWGEDMMILFNTNKIINVERIGPKDKIDKFELHKEGMEISKRQLQENLNNIIYTAVFFDTNEIVSKYPQVHPNLYSHHSTIQFKPTDISNLPIGEEINIKVIGRLTNDKVDALIVSNPLSKNKFPHITLSTAQGIKPFQSNGEIENNQEDIETINDNLIGIFGYFDGRNEVTEKQTQFEGMEISKKDLENQKWIDNNPQKVGEITKGELEEENFMFEITKSELEEEKKKKADRCLKIARRKMPQTSAYRSGLIVQCRRGKIWKK